MSSDSKTNRGLASNCFVIIARFDLRFDALYTEVTRLGLFANYSVQSKEPQEWSRMARNSAEHFRDALLDKCDSPQITDLIEQLERDLKETRKSSQKSISLPQKD